MLNFEFLEEKLFMVDVMLANYIEISYKLYCYFELSSIERIRLSSDHLSFLALFATRGACGVL